MNNRNQNMPREEMYTRQDLEIMEEIIRAANYYHTNNPYNFSTNIIGVSEPPMPQPVQAPHHEPSTLVLTPIPTPTLLPPSTPAAPSSVAQARQSDPLPGSMLLQNHLLLVPIAQSTTPTTTTTSTLAQNMAVAEQQFGPARQNMGAPLQMPLLPNLRQPMPPVGYERHGMAIEQQQQHHSPPMPRSLNTQQNQMLSQHQRRYPQQQQQQLISFPGNFWVNVPTIPTTMPTTSAGHSSMPAMSPDSFQLRHNEAFDCASEAMCTREDSWSPLFGPFQTLPPVATPQRQQTLPPVATPQRQQYQQFQRSVEYLERECQYSEQFVQQQQTGCLSVSSATTGGVTAVVAPQPMPSLAHDLAATSTATIVATPQQNEDRPIAAVMPIVEEHSGIDTMTDGRTAVAPAPVAVPENITRPSVEVGPLRRLTYSQVVRNLQPPVNNEQVLTDTANSNRPATDTVTVTGTGTPTTFTASGSSSPDNELVDSIAFCTCNANNTNRLSDLNIHEIDMNQSCNDNTLISNNSTTTVASMNGNDNSNRSRSSSDFNVPNESDALSYNFARLVTSSSTPAEQQQAGCTRRRRRNRRHRRNVDVVHSSTSNENLLNRNRLRQLASNTSNTSITTRRNNNNSNNNNNNWIINQSRSDSRNNNNIRNCINDNNNNNKSDNNCSGNSGHGGRGGRGGRGRRRRRISNFNPIPCSSSSNLDNTNRRNNKKNNNTNQNINNQNTVDNRPAQGHQNRRQRPQQQRARQLRQQKQEQQQQQQQQQEEEERQQQQQQQQQQQLNKIKKHCEMKNKTKACRSRRNRRRNRNRNVANNNDTVILNSIRDSFLLILRLIYALILLISNLIFKWLK